MYTICSKFLFFVTTCYSLIYKSRWTYIVNTSSASIWVTRPCLKIKKIRTVLLFYKVHLKRWSLLSWFPTPFALNSMYLLSNCILMQTWYLWCHKALVWLVNSIWGLVWIFVSQAKCPSTLATQLTAKNGEIWW